MLICPTVFSKMKRECTLVQGKCNKVVTSATPPSHDLKSEHSKNSINFFSHSQLQYKICDLINLLLLPHIAYPLTRRSHSSQQVLATVVLFLSRVYKLRPAKTFFQSWSKFIRITCWFGRMWYFPKQSHNVRCPALDVVWKLMWPSDKKV